MAKGIFFNAPTDAPRLKDFNSFSDYDSAHKSWLSDAWDNSWLKSKFEKIGSFFGFGGGSADKNAEEALQERSTDIDNELYKESALQQQEFEQSSAREAMDFEAGQAQINRDFQTGSNKLAMDFEADQARINRDWQEKMSNTAYQRAVADMKEAGINPILAVNQGGAAVTSGSSASGHSSSGSSASGHKASGSKASVQSYTELLASLVSSASRLTQKYLINNRGKR